MEEDLARVQVGHRDGRVEGVLHRLLWQTDECALAEDHNDGLLVDLTTYLQVAELWQVGAAPNAIAFVRVQCSNQPRLLRRAQLVCLYQQRERLATSLESVSKLHIYICINVQIDNTWVHIYIYIYTCNTFWHCTYFKADPNRGSDKCSHNMCKSHTNGRHMDVDTSVSKRLRTHNIYIYTYPRMVQQRVL